MSHSPSCLIVKLELNGVSIELLHAGLWVQALQQAGSLWKNQKCAPTSLSVAQRVECWTSTMLRVVGLCLALGKNFLSFSTLFILQ